MADLPILFFPLPIPVDRDRGYGGGGKYRYPEHVEQVKRTVPMFKSLIHAMQSKQMFLQTNLEGVEPKMVLVIEIIGSLSDFIKAVKKVPHLEWMGELDDSALPPNESFYEVSHKTNIKKERELLPRKIYMLMSNQRALKEILSLYDLYRSKQKFNRKLANWRHVFEQLANIRVWDVSDRIENTGILQDWQDRVNRGEESSKFEVELWYHKNKSDRDEALSSLRKLVEEDGGKVIYDVVLDDIFYHGVQVQAPISTVKRLLDHKDLKFIQYDEVMFIRPIGQTSPYMSSTEYDNIEGNKNSSLADSSPIIALLDGLPLEQHSLLKDYLIIDDPDDYASSYKSHEQRHGTSMASLIIHGDLNGNAQSISHPIYVRPIMKPNPQDFRDTREESIPDDYLPIDLVHKALVKIVNGDENSPPIDTIKVINLSVGNAYRPFDLTISPWARLIDWFSYKYKILFVISAGNWFEKITLDIPTSEFKALSLEEKRKLIIKHIIDNLWYRKLLSPSEALNALSVGCANSDRCQFTPPNSDYIDIILPGTNFSAISSYGSGHRRSIKPDFLVPGGRQYFEISGNSQTQTYLNPRSSARSGQKVASPGEQGELSYTKHVIGTSNSAAITCHHADLIIESILSNPAFSDSDNIVKSNLSLIAKALLTHSASWGESLDVIKRITGKNNDECRDLISCLEGYGLVNLESSTTCMPHKVTLVGTGELTKDSAHEYNFPFPASLTSKVIWRRFTTTLAWFSPINVESQKYRVAQLAMDFDKDSLLLSRTHADWQATRRGTLQHEIFEGDRAIVLKDSNLKIKVNCREDATGLYEPIPYAIAVSLEVSDQIGVDIYNEVKTRIRPEVRIK